MTTREEAAVALFQFAETIRWRGANGQSGFSEMHRRVKTWDDLSSQPALCQTSGAEDINQTTGLAYKLFIRFKWLIFHQVGQNDPAAIPDTETNAILDAVQAAFTPAGPDALQTLPTPDHPAGAVHHAWLDGRIEKYPGDQDGQTLIVVPISVLVP